MQLIVQNGTLLQLKHRNTHQSKRVKPAIPGVRKEGAYGSILQEKSSRIRPSTTENDYAEL